MTAADTAAGSPKTLRLHKFNRQYRGHSGTSEKDFIVDFLFSIQDAGAKAQTFWTEVRLRENLRGQGEWASLSEENSFRALYAFAVDAIRRAGGRPIRSMSIGWKSHSPYANGPCWDLSRVNLRNPAAETIEGEGVTPVVVHQH